ncbi:MAG: hypothetical protein VKL39_20930 [Leptolyngbyaceae bacterium]|nr:hypothetical protein [Leptolyngbyaceae bacterium]
MSKKITLSKSWKGAADSTYRPFLWSSGAFISAQAFNTETYKYRYTSTQ